MPVALTIGLTIDDIARRAEVDAAYDRLAWELGRQQGLREGRAGAAEHIDAIRLDRGEIHALRPTGESCTRCGAATYTTDERRRHRQLLPTSPPADPWPPIRPARPNLRVIRGRSE